MIYRGFDYTSDKFVEIWHIDIRANIKNGTAYVGGNDFKNFCGSSGQPPDTQTAVYHHHPQAGAGKEVVEVAIGPVKLDVSIVQFIVQDRHNFSLQLRPEIDQEVAASDQVHLGKRWVFGQILFRENTQVPNAFADPVPFMDLREEALGTALSDLQDGVEIKHVRDGVFNIPILSRLQKPCYFALVCLP